MSSTYRRVIYAYALCLLRLAIICHDQLYAANKSAFLQDTLLHHHDPYTFIINSHDDDDEEGNGDADNDDNDDDSDDDDDAQKGSPSITPLFL